MENKNSVHSFDQAFATLNPQQKSAVTHTQGPLLVIAGAGSGKTKVATMRVAYLIQKGVSPQSIVGVTFTNKAAKEMKERVHSLVQSNVTISTFHSLGATILREHIHNLGFPSSFSIYDEEESSKILKECLKESSLNYQDSLFSSLRSSISSIKNNPSAQVPNELLGIYQAYQKKLKASGAVDFDDLIYLPLTLFREFPKILDLYQSRWTHLLVDEYQDTNDTQHLLSSALVQKSLNIFAVGDPDQSIYGWRGAKIGHILSFQTQFQGAKVIRLEQNYRSTSTILDASNKVIQHNVGRLEKDLWSNKGKGDPLIKHIAKSERQEADFVVQTIKKLLQSGVAHSEIAILYRTNAQSRPFEDQFIGTHTPYRIWGGIPFYSRKEIKDVLSFIKIALLPQDTMAFDRSIKAIGQGIGEVTLSKLKALSIEKEQPLLSAVENELTEPTSSLTKRQKTALSSFCSIIEKLKVKLQDGCAFSLISSAIHDTGYLSSLEEDDKESFSDRKENLEQLLGRAQEWDESHDNKPSYLFFEELILEGAQIDNGDSKNKVTLATIHNAKGLEFRVVFLVGLEEDLFPHMNAKRTEEGIEEERRLFYVGMTRAKESLFVTAAESRFLFGGLHSMRLSRFLKEIPEVFMKKASSFSSCSPIGKPMYTTISQPKPFVPEEVASPGQIVMHPQFGIGRIEKIVTTSLGDAYEVFFSNDQAKRKILISSSPLKAVGKHG